MHLEYGPRYSGFLQGICLLIQRYFCADYDYMEKGDFSKTCQRDPKRKFGSDGVFFRDNRADIWKKMPYTLFILKLL